MENNLYDLAVKRRSIRKFKETPIPHEDIEYFISCAVNAPSGCNSQCWHFVAVEDKTLIERLAEETAKGAREFYGTGFPEATEEFLISREKATSFFRNAPLVIFVFLDRMDYYDERVSKAFSAKGFSKRQMLDTLAYPDILSIGATVQNMLLAIAEKGYGACWMNDPVIGENRIKNLLQVRNDLRLISVVPIGIPNYVPREKKLKNMSEVIEYR
ncbi:nitroreductase family protein [Ruminiclostridium cellulolyticum]|uniref:Nitroreductase n=1 Tax=Ruminiclostridium cellulolyticum (strain ATCC 35319 / DSM 5812 / JCM 6584 / H10) TaxID=394503 RepID=B8I1T0_RUMCH|nr:nitroreductase family protein [Ruminiclostridium cellulolyticum]ACL77715.1 nitroreductase [Ruminiclostridium cellulolyticum H10]